MGCCSSDSKVTVDPNSVPEKPGTNKGGGQHRRVPSDSKSKIPKYEAGGPEDQWIKAVEANDNKKIKHLVKQYHKKVKFIKIRFENGDNSLHCAVRSNNNKLVKFLLLMKMSEKINDKSLFNGNTALHYAVMNNKEGMVKTLIANHNIKLDIKNSKGETPLDIAKKQDDKHIASLLEKHLKLDDESIARLTNNIDNPSTDRDGNNTTTNNSNSKIHHKVANSQSSTTMGDDNDDNKMNSYKETNNNNNNNNNKNDFANIMRDDSKSKSNNKNNKKNTSNNAVRVEPDSDEKESSRTGTGGGGGSGGSGAAGLELDTAQPPSNVLNIIDQTTPIDDDDDDETDTSRQSSNYKYNENSDNEDNIISNNNNNNNSNNSNNDNNNDENSGDLPVLEGMLEKKRSKAPSIYQKRWVQVKKPYIFWNEKKFDVQDVTSKKEREKANGCIKFDDIANVTKKKSKSEQTKFIINIRKSNDKKDDRQMTFRCSSEAIRDEWVEGLQKYLDF